MHNVVDDRHMLLARKLKAVYSRYQRNRDLIAVGAYVGGSDPYTDQAIAMYPQVAAFLQQGMNDRATLGQSLSAMSELLKNVPNGPM